MNNMSATETSTYNVYDVVFIVEGTASLGGYFDSLKSSYLTPTLEHFNGGPPEEIDYGCDYSCSLYSLVVYKAADCAPEPTVTIVPPTTSTHNFTETLNNISFLGGAGEGCSHMAEGLATALQLFEDLKSIREPSITTEKHCILLCNSPPYSVPCQETARYSGFNADRLSSVMASIGVKFSVISPRKMPVLYKIYDVANGESTTSLQMKNYTTDSRHLVLLNGYSLQECPLSPGIQESRSPSPTLPPIPVPSPPVQPIRKTSPPPFIQPPRPTNLQQVRLPQVTPMGRGRPRIPSGGVPQMPTPQTSMPNAVPDFNQGRGMPINAGRGRGMVNPGQPNTAGGFTNVQGQFGGMNQPRMGMGGKPIMVPGSGGGIVASQANAMSQPGQMPVTGSMTSQQDNKGMMSTPGGMMPNTTMNTSMPNQGGLASHDGSIQIPDAASTLAEQAQVQQNALQQRRDIWSGIVEWHEKGRNMPEPAQRISHALQCHVSINQGETDINTSKWPQKLLMQLIPQQLLHPLQDMFRNSRTVIFNFGNNDLEALKHLYKVMASGFAGCMHFPNVSQCDVRVLMLLYSTRKKQFMGLIPNEQNQFVNGIRKVITARRQQQQQQIGQGGVAGQLGVPPVVGAPGQAPVQMGGPRGALPGQPVSHMPGIGVSGGSGIATQAGLGQPRQQMMPQSQSGMMQGQTMMQSQAGGLGPSTLTISGGQVQQSMAGVQGGMQGPAGRGAGTAQPNNMTNITQQQALMQAQARQLQSQAGSLGGFQSADMPGQSAADAGQPGQWQAPNQQEQLQQKIQALQQKLNQAKQQEQQQMYQRQAEQQRIQGNIGNRMMMPGVSQPQAGAPGQGVQGVSQRMPGMSIQQTVPAQAGQGMQPTSQQLKHLLLNQQQQQQQLAQQQAQRQQMMMAGRARAPGQQTAMMGGQPPQPGMQQQQAMVQPQQQAINFDEFL